MPTLALFGISIVMCFVAFGLFSKVHLWPWLRARPSGDALRILLVPHTFRFVGLSFLVPGVVLLLAFYHGLSTGLDAGAPGA